MSYAGLEANSHLESLVTLFGVPLAVSRVPPPLLRDVARDLSCPQPIHALKPTQHIGGKARTLVSGLIFSIRYLAGWFLGRIFVFVVRLLVYSSIVAVALFLINSVLLVATFGLAFLFNRALDKSDIWLFPYRQEFSRPLFCEFSIL